MALEYPSTFEQLLSGSRPLRAGIDQLANLFDGWLSTSRVPFFIDYTDHGVEHLNQVLATANGLITEAARAVFTAADAAVLTAATLFHDSALHLSEAGFHDLIRGAASKWELKGFNDRPWPVLWDEFLFSAKRWDERKLKDVLGETRDGALRAEVRDPFVHYDNLSDTDRKLIGEFVRRHHPRMAHEFAVYGIPGKKLISVEGTLSADLRDLAGLVARSHGQSVRSCLPYLHPAPPSKYHRREYKGVHAVYLMTLLRVADYLQIQADRANTLVFQYRHIPSKFSEQEWKAHNAVSNITQTHDDPESIEIQAHPEDVRTYLRLKEWLNGIQTELDASWAVLGETYGLHPELCKFGLILRRVRSNLDDPAAFAQTVEYVPQRIELAVARPDLLKLLVGPLYDNIPSIGIRELMQNAIDAVREREVLQERYPELKKAPLIELSNNDDVEIRIGPADEKGMSWLTVRDRGAGMTVETVRDYFLTAGASFRNSDAWKREFETDDAPRSRVLRAGRFGVGVLAGFLLGPRMEVTTRHIRANRGLQFSTEMDLRPIELRHAPKARVGTEVRIQISATIRDQLIQPSSRVLEPDRFGWFVYDAPRVGRYIDRGPVESQRFRRNASKLAPQQHLAQQYSTPQPKSWEMSGFRQLFDNERCGYSLFWTYRSLPALVVNGIFITESQTRSRFSEQLIGNNRSRIYNDGVRYHIAFPNICVEDSDAVFPLNVRRSDITERHYPFEKDLFMAIIDDYLAYLLVYCPTNSISANHNWPGSHPGINPDTDYHEQYVSLKLPNIFFHQSGVALLSSRLRQQLRVDVIDIAIGSVDRYQSAKKQVDGESKSDSATICNGDTFITSAAMPDGATVHAAVSSPHRTYDNWLENASADVVAAFGAFALAFPAHRSDASQRGASQIERILSGQDTVVAARCACPTRIHDKIRNPIRLINEITGRHSGRMENAERHARWEREISTLLLKYSETIPVERTVAGYTLFATPGCPPTRWEPHLKSLAGREGSACFIEIFLAKSTPDTPREEPGPITKRWNEVFRQPFIPFDPEARRQQLAHAYKELEPFIRVHEAMKAAGVNY